MLAVSAFRLETFAVIAPIEDVVICAVEMLPELTDDIFAKRKKYELLFTFVWFGKILLILHIHLL